MAVTGRDRSTVPRPASDRSASTRRVAAHSRPRTWRSIRIRIMLPVLVAIAGIVVLSAMHIADAVAEAGQADRAATLAGAMGTIASLVHEVGREYVASEHAARSPATRTRDQQVE